MKPLPARGPWLPAPGSCAPCSSWPAVVATIMADPSPGVTTAPPAPPPRPPAPSAQAAPPTGGDRRGGDHLGAALRDPTGPEEAAAGAADDEDLLPCGPGRHAAAGPQSQATGHGLRRRSIGADGHLEGEDGVARGKGAGLRCPAERADEDGEVGPRGDGGAGHGCLRRVRWADVEGEGRSRYARGVTALPTAGGPGTISAGRAAVPRRRRARDRPPRRCRRAGGPEARRRPARGGRRAHRSTRRWCSCGRFVGGFDCDSTVMASVSRPWSANDPAYDDPPLGDQRRARRRGAQLLPELGHLAVAAQGAVAVGEHRVLLGGAVQAPERLELGDRQLPAPQPVVGEPQELAHGLGRREPARPAGAGSTRASSKRSRRKALLASLSLTSSRSAALAATALRIDGSVGEVELVGAPSRPDGRERAAADGLGGLAAHDALVDPDLGLPGLAALGARRAEGLRGVPGPGVAHPAGPLAGNAAPARLLELGGVVGPPLPRRPLALAGRLAALGACRPCPAGRAGRPRPEEDEGGGLGMERSSLSGWIGAKTTKDPWSPRGPSLSENSAASYSPRASRPKYHRRWRA